MIPLLASLSTCVLFSTLLLSVSVSEGETVDYRFELIDSTRNGTSAEIHLTIKSDKQDVEELLWIYPHDGAMSVSSPEILQVIRHDRRAFVLFSQAERLWAVPFYKVDGKWFPFGGITLDYVSGEGSFGHAYDKISVNFADDGRVDVVLTNNGSVTRHRTVQPAPTSAPTSRPFTLRKIEPLWEIITP